MGLKFAGDFRDAGLKWGRSGMRGRARGGEIVMVIDTT